MIACFSEDIHLEEISIKDEDYTHLVSALRVKIDDTILVLDGNGKSKTCKVSKIGKKEVILTGGAIENHKRFHTIDLLLSPPKRDSLNDCLRAACELGIRKIYLFQSEFCQNKKIDTKRINKVLKSALVQSNNHFLPEVISLENNELKDIEDYDSSYIFHLDEDAKTGLVDGPIMNPLLVIGPEGGFSSTDMVLLEESLRSPSITKLTTPIMRTHTALCVASGWLLSKI